MFNYPSSLSPLFADSYLENQRRRTLRDAQGYYFPYKKYNLKDYKDMQKLNNPNPYAEIPETTIDRVRFHSILIEQCIFIIERTSEKTSRIWYSN